MLLKSRRSTRWPYLFRSTVLGGFCLDAFVGTTWKSEEFWDVLSDDDDNALLLFEGVLLADLRVSEAAYWLGEGVRTDCGFGGAVVTAAFQGAQTGVVILVSLNISGNFVILYEAFMDSISFSKAVPSMRETRPVKSISANVFSRIWM